jgi:hypothetical protein
MDWFKASKKDPIRAIVKAFQLPPESRLKKANGDPQRWDEIKQLLSLLELRDRQMIWLSSLQVDSDTVNKAQKKSPFPTEPFTPKDVLEFVEEVENTKTQQERDERASAVLTHEEELKNALAAPRKAAEDAEGMDER